MSLFSEGVVMTAIYWLLNCIEILIFTRVILSLISASTHREWKITVVFVTLTEPLLAPIRKLLGKFEAIRNLPIDLSIIVLWLIIETIKGIIFGY